MAGEDQQSHVVVEAIRRLSNQTLIFLLAVVFILAGLGVALAANGADIWLVAIVVGALLAVSAAGVLVAGRDAESTPAAPPTGPGQAPVVGSVDERRTSPSLLTTSQLDDLRRQVSHSVFKEMKRTGTPGETGWSHLIGPGTDSHPVQVLGSAYGLMTLGLLGCADPGYRVDEVVDTLHALAGEGGAWGSSSQGGHPSAEATATVLRALRAVGRLDARCDPAREWLNRVAAGGDGGLDRLHVATTVLSYAAGDERLAEARDALAKKLLDGSNNVDGRQCYWGVTVGDASPSMVHTCRAVVALAGQSTADPAIRPTVEAARRWIVDRIEARPESSQAFSFEQIVRPVPFMKLQVWHFTPAWVAGALKGVRGIEGIDTATAIAESDVMRSYVVAAGLWASSVSGFERPIWMTYQGAAALLGGDLA